MAYRWGESVGKEANILGVHGWYAPAMNVHRSPLGGRNFEYFSEDPLLSGKMSASAVQGAQSQNILVFLKHFALNEQEINARSGIMIWANEQAIREVGFAAPLLYRKQKCGFRRTRKSGIISYATNSITQ